MIHFQIENNLAAFNSTLGLYMQATSKLPDDVLEKKGRDLGIKLYQGFAAHKWGGAGTRKAGLARAQLDARTAAGEGTKVRASLLREYFSKRTEVRAEVKAASAAQAFGPQNKSTQNAGARLKLRGIKRRVALWQSFVGREIKIRQGGIGVLAASFLWFRSRSSQARGTYYVKNKQGSRNLGFVEKGDGFLRIVGLTEGLAVTDARFSIVSNALAKSTADMLEYIARKNAESFQAAFGVSA